MAMSLVYHRGNASLDKYTLVLRLNALCNFSKNFYCLFFIFNL